MTTRVTIALSAACVVVTACAANPAGTTSFPDRAWTDAPIELVRNQIVVSTRIEGRAPYSCLIDTGANPSVIDIALARRLRLPIGDKGGAAEGIGKEGVTVFPTAFEVGIAAAQARRIDAVAMDLAPLSRPLGRPIDCILGQSWLTSQVVLIDYLSQQLRVSPTGMAAPPALYKCTESPMRFWMADDSMPVVDVAVNGVEIPVSLDTGSSATLKLFPAGALRAGIAAPAAAERGQVIGARGAAAIGRIAIASLRFGPVTVENVQGSVGEKNDGEPEGRLGNLGNGVLRNGVLTLDFPGRRIRMCAPSG